MTQNNLFGEPIPAPTASGNLGKRFIVPPFSVLDGRQGYWLDRKRWWKDTIGIKGEEGRDGTKGGITVSHADYMPKIGTDISVFDPVLCELMYTWFCPIGGRIIDPFAGEATKGIVAAHLGYNYTGFELRQEQVDNNCKQFASHIAKGNAQWIAGDSRETIGALSSEDLFDFSWTSPPYFDLEQYSDEDADGSTASSYLAFRIMYEEIYKKTIRQLKYGRFLALKIGEVRNKRGYYIDFVGWNIHMFRELGLHYYNEIILLDPCGSAPARANKQFDAYRKVVKVHQNILIFYKGGWKGVDKNDFKNTFKHFGSDTERD